MSITLATKGVIGGFSAGSGTGENIYVPVTKPGTSTEVVGEVEIYTINEQSRLSIENIKPSIGIKDFKPIIKTE
jgi:hypothetical protein